jgi:uncharacterized protein (DUF1015 family)
MTAAFEIAPLRALRFDPRSTGKSGPRPLDPVVAPPYDIISPDEHRALLARSPRNIVRLTLGDRPGERADYAERARMLEAWKADGTLAEDPREALFVYGADYSIPGSKEHASFRGIYALGSLHDFSEGVVLPHEHTFPKVVDDRQRLLEATRTHIESILLLYSDEAGEIDRVLMEASAGPPETEVEARPGEIHSLWSIRGRAEIDRLRDLFRRQRPIIGDGHHRYTTAVRYAAAHKGDPGAGWQPMVLGNLFGKGLSILATHRLVRVGGRIAEALRILEERMAPTAVPGLAAAGGRPAAFEVEMKDGRKMGFSFPEALLASKKGVARTAYALLHDVVLGEWLKPLLAAGAKSGEEPIRYFKEGTGEREALLRGDGDLLFRMWPVGREEFRDAVEGGEVFPHKTTFFYPKLWSGLVLWTMADPGPEAPKA